MQIDFLFDFLIEKKKVFGILSYSVGLDISFAKLGNICGKLASILWLTP